MDSAQSALLGLRVHAADRLLRLAEGGIIRINDNLRQERCDLARRQSRGELQLDNIADHALTLGPYNVQRELRRRRVRTLFRQEPHLWTVTVRHHDVMVSGEIGDNVSRKGHVSSLGFGGHGLTSLQQRISTEGNDNKHGCPPLEAALGQELDDQRRQLGLPIVRVIVADSHDWPLEPEKAFEIEGRRDHHSIRR